MIDLKTDVLKQLPDTPNIPSQIHSKAPDQSACLTRTQSDTSNLHRRRILPGRQVEYAVVGIRSNIRSI